MTSKEKRAVLQSWMNAFFSGSVIACLKLKAENTGTKRARRK